MNSRSLSFALFACLVASNAAAQVQAPTIPAATPAPRHEASFDAERKQADELFVAGKRLEALPLYEDLCRQDQTIAVFAERHGLGLLLQAATLSDRTQATPVHNRGIAELLRAKKLGDNSPIVQQMLEVDTKSTPGAMLSGMPLTVGYKYAGNAAAREALKQGNAAFSKEDWTGAAALFKNAAALDPAWYIAALYTGDAYFRAKDLTDAPIWFEKAVAIDPDRETGYRYWADALVQSGDLQAARQKFELAVVAEPFEKTPFLALEGWGRRAKVRIFRPQVVRPDFTAPDGKLEPGPSQLTRAGDGHDSWLVYQQTRVAHGAHFLNQPAVAGSTTDTGMVHATGYRHSLAEEDASIVAMLTDIQTRLNAGTLAVDDLEPSIKLLRQFQKEGFLDCWIFMSAADAGIRVDYPAYRAAHRDLLVAYVDRYMVLGPAPPHS